MLTLALALLAQAQAAPQTAPDPLAPARAGKVQCIGPNREKKTCLSMARYKTGPDGTFESTVVMMINPNPLITMETHAKGKIEAGGTCSIIRAEDYAASTFTMNGGPMDDSTAATIRAQVAAIIAPMAGKRGCSRERPEGDMLVSEATLDGVARPDMTQKVIWISPTDGYTLGTP